MLSYLDASTGSMLMAAFAGGAAGIGVLVPDVRPPDPRCVLQEAQGAGGGELRRADGQDPLRLLDPGGHHTRSRIVPGSALARLRRRRRGVAGAQRGGLADFEAYAATQAFADAQDDGRVVATTAVPVAEAPVGDGWAGALRHERVRVITYPYEWTFSMLKDAALLQLDLSREALAEGILTKDATSYNVQFDGARPVFIDVGSFERLVPGEPWPGYRQFCELFLNPLYLQADRRRAVPALAARVGARDLPHRRGARSSAAAVGSGATSSPTCASTPAPRRATPMPTPSAT